MKFEFKNDHILPHGVLSGDIEIPDKGVLYLCGENGVGKSSLLDYIRNNTDFKKLSYIPQEEIKSFYSIKVGDFFFYFLENLQCLDLSQNIDDLFDIFQFDAFKNQDISQISGGQRQALKILMGLSKRSDYYFLDEPWTYMDAKKKEKLLAWIQKRSESQSFLIVDHGLDKINSLSYEMKFQDSKIRLQRQK